MKIEIVWVVVLVASVPISAFGQMTDKEVRAFKKGMEVRTEDGAVFRTTASFGTEMLELPPDVNGIVVRMRVLSRSSFDRNIFQNEDDPVRRREHLRMCLARRIAYEGRLVPLSESDREKLNVAGLGDIRRFQDEVEERRVEFEAVRLDMKEGLGVLSRLRPLGGGYRYGPFNEGSLYAKTLAKILADREAAQVKD